MNNFDRELRIPKDISKPTDIFKQALYNAVLSEIYLLWNNNIDAWATHGQFIITQDTKMILLFGQSRFPTLIYNKLLEMVLLRIRTEFDRCTCGAESSWRECNCGSKCQIQLFQEI